MSAARQPAAAAPRLLRREAPVLLPVALGLFAVLGVATLVASTARRSTASRSNARRRPSGTPAGWRAPARARARRRALESYVARPAAGQLGDALRRRGPDPRRGRCAGRGGLPAELARRRARRGGRQRRGPERAGGAASSRSSRSAARRRGLCALAAGAHARGAAARARRADAARAPADASPPARWSRSSSAPSLRPYDRAARARARRRRRAAEGDDELDFSSPRSTARWPRSARPAAISRHSPARSAARSTAASCCSIPRGACWR
jgi:hypothetical protein